MSTFAEQQREMARVVLQRDEALRLLGITVERLGGEITVLGTELAKGRRVEKIPVGGPGGDGCILRSTPQ